MNPTTAFVSQSAPRAYVHGPLSVTVDYQMPDLSLVRSQATKVTALMQAPVPPRVFVHNARGEAIGPIPLALWYNDRLPQLFKFSYLCAIEDVPEDILPQCVWSLEWIIRAFLEASDEQLRIFHHLAPEGQDDSMPPEIERYLALKNCRYKLVDHLLSPQINQPLEALRHIRCSIEALKEHSGKSDIFLINPGLYALFAVCLARTRIDDVEAKVALSRVMKDTTFKAGALTTCHRVEATVYLARVLRRLGEDSEAHKLEMWLVRWFKKHPHEFGDNVLVKMFTTDIDPAVDPVFTGLGGSKWLDNRKATLKTQIRTTKTCRHCHAREPAVKLSQCAQCQYMFYCSKECQKMNWPYHKVYCREAAALLKKIAEIETINAPTAQKFRDWIAYRDNPRSETLEDFAHALGLTRDTSRGRTHIVYQEVEYVPSIKNQLDKFRTTGVGVFKLDDVWQDLELRMGLDPGEGKEYICDMLDEFDHGPGRGPDNAAPLPMFNLMFSATSDVQVYLRITSISRGKVAFMRPKPDWRRHVNTKGEPPVHISLDDGKIVDAEYIF
ncbi:hypothetical protein EDD18DRAFT_1138989 [Armillaria luteobubalina]|uniref:MYND-type domain-containing protein n=1 Tax=Armillaria luteobubalina TaxID=153913 RepID=A0AA39QFL8_9AGAR|nr:hypothetical protein EDD18DRAFT_1138989 [Armillaria luteobubalina]